MMGRGRHSQAPESAAGGAAGRRISRAGKVVGAIILCCALGCLWVWKETWHERLSSRMLSLEGDERQQMALRGNLRQELLAFTEYGRIDDLARSRLGMVSPHTPPDTVWCSTGRCDVKLGSVTTCSFRLPGVDL